MQTPISSHSFQGDFRLTFRLENAADQSTSCVFAARISDRSCVPERRKLSDRRVVDPLHSLPINLPALLKKMFATKLCGLRSYRGNQLDWSAPSSVGRQKNQRIG